MFNISCTVGLLDDNFGIAVADAGDVDEDGYADMLVGAYHADPAGDNSGRVTLFSGRDGFELYSLAGGSAGDEFGIAVAGLGDLNDDGYSDILVGAHLNGDGGHEAGTAQVYFLGDVDNDLLIYSCDNCPFVFNPLQSDTNGDGVGDACEGVTCGDANSDDNTNISDAVYLIAYIFAGGPAPEPLSAGDINCDGAANISDAVYLITYIFAGGSPPCDLDSNGIPDC